MAILTNPRHEAFAQALARGMSASAAYVEAGYKANRHNAAALAREQHIGTRVTELQEEQLAIHQQATAAAAANKQVTIESLIAEAEAARAKAMSEKGGAAAAVSALTAKAKLAGMWREKVDQHNTGSPVYERIERVIVEPAPQSAPGNITTSARTRSAVSVWAQNMIGRAMRQMHSGIWQSLTRSRRLIPEGLGDRHPHASALTGRTELSFDAWKVNPSRSF